MTQSGDPQSSSTGPSGDDFRKIDGIGRILERRLWDAGILTYNDLGQRTPEEIAAILPSTAGISAERIASQDWTGRARELAEHPPEASVPRQHYAAFYVEFLLESDNSVRGTRVHHHQTDARESWAGWDEEKLLTFLRDRIPLSATATPATDIPADAQLLPRTRLPMRPPLNPRRRASRRPPFPAGCRPGPWPSRNSPPSAMVNPAIPFHPTNRARCASPCASTRLARPSPTALTSPPRSRPVGSQVTIACPWGPLTGQFA